MAGILRYEWRRITTIRSTWILLGLAVIFSIGFSWLAMAGLKSATSTPDSGLAPNDLLITEIVGQVVVANFIVLVLFATVAAQAFGQEYRNGTIRVTLTAFPKRLPVVLGKVIVCLGLLTAVFAVCVAAPYLLLSSSDVVNSDISVSTMLGFFLRSWLYFCGYMLVVIALTLITRILALAVIIPLLMAVVFENLASALGSRWLPWIDNVLPFASGSRFVAGGEDLLRNGLVFGAWVLVLSVVGVVLFQKRDA